MSWVEPLAYVRSEVDPFFSQNRCVWPRLLPSFSLGFRDFLPVGRPVCPLFLEAIISQVFPSAMLKTFHLNTQARGRRSTT